MAQGMLAFTDDGEKTGFGATALAGLPLYLELAVALGLTASIQDCLHLRDSSQGWDDRQIVLGLVLLNLAGGDCVEDLERLEQDAGFRQVHRRVEHHDRKLSSQGEVQRRWRRGRRRSVPSRTVAFRYPMQCGRPPIVNEPKRHKGHR